MVKPFPEEKEEEEEELQEVIYEEREKYTRQTVKRVEVSHVLTYSNLLHA